MEIVEVRSDASSDVIFHCVHGQDECVDEWVFTIALKESHFFTFQ